MAPERMRYELDAFGGVQLVAGAIGTYDGASSDFDVWLYHQREKRKARRDRRAAKKAEKKRRRG